jgi:hypothetical protein
MIKLRSMQQIQALSTVLDTEAGTYGGVDISQRNDGIVGVSRLNGSGKMERHIYIMTDGDTKEVHSATEEPQD